MSEVLKSCLLDRWYQYEVWFALLLEEKQEGRETDKS